MRKFSTYQCGSSVVSALPVISELNTYINMFKQIVKDCKYKPAPYQKCWYQIYKKCLIENIK